MEGAEEEELEPRREPSTMRRQLASDGEGEGERPLEPPPRDQRERETPETHQTHAAHEERAKECLPGFELVGFDLLRFGVMTVHRRTSTRLLRLLRRLRHVDVAVDVDAGGAAARSLVRQPMRMLMRMMMRMGPPP